MTKHRDRNISGNSPSPRPSPEGRGGRSFRSSSFAHLLMSKTGLEAGMVVGAIGGGGGVSVVGGGCAGCVAGGWRSGIGRVVGSPWSAGIVAGTTGGGGGGGSAVAGIVTAPPPAPIPVV